MIEQAGTNSRETDRGTPGTASGGLWRTLLRMLERGRQRRALADLDARLLSDIGRTREEALREADKRAWRR